MSEHETNWLTKRWRRLLPASPVQAHRPGGGWRGTGTCRLGDIEHVVILMQENRSFDHYFGTMSGGARVLRPGRATRRSAERGTRSSTSSATSPAPAPTRPATCSRSAWSATRR